MRLTLALVMFATAAAAGPVGEYLGFEVNKQATALRAGKDSIHFLLPSPGDSVFYRNNADTATVLSETLYQGDPAWLTRRISMPVGFAEFTDTARELQDTLLCGRMAIGDSLFWVNLYRVPFELGATWDYGLDGIYAYDLNGDSITDTLTIWGDTCIVADTEDVVVPYDTVPHCYKLLRTMRQRLATEMQGVPVIESSYIQIAEWYKDSLWSVKESVHASGPIYTKIVIWLHAADFVSVDTRQLTGLSFVGLQEHALPGVGDGRLSVSPTLFRGRMTVTLPSDISAHAVAVYNSAGRLVARSPVPHAQPGGRRSLVLDLRGLPAGVYVVHAGRLTESATKVSR